MVEKNPFLFDKDFAKTSGLSQEQITYLKGNNIFLFSILSNIFTGNGDPAMAKEKLPQHMMQVLTGELYYTDSETGFNTNDLGGKFKYLLLELDKSPKAREIFTKSFFTKSLKKLFIGNAWKESKTSWADYKLKSNSQLPAYVSAQDNTLVGALNIYANNGNEVGIDMSKVIDTIIGKDKDGNYVIKPTVDLGTINQLTEAVAEQTKILKTSQKFMDLYQDTTKSGREKDGDADPEAE